MLYLLQGFTIIQITTMLQKLNKKNEKGIELYQEVLLGDKTQDHKKFYGSVGTLKELSYTFIPSQRHDKRHIEPLISKIHSNRKTTLGRIIYYQPFKLINGGWNHLKQMQETSSAIKRKTVVLEFRADCEKKRILWEEKMIERLKLSKTI